MTASLLADQKVRRRFRLAYNNPADFARLFLRLTPTDQQIELFNSVAQPGAKVAVRSGHGVGKSTSLGVLALWFLCTRPEAKIPCSAPTGHQLMDILWPEIRRLHARMPDWMREQITITTDKISRDGSSGFIVARTARPENPDALQGFHADNILFLLDEASGIHDAIFTVARGALSTPDARVVMTGNPTRLTGYFYNAFHLSRDSWTRLHFSCLDSPLVAPNYAEEIVAEYGEDSDMYRVRVLGDFPKSGIYNLIPLDLVEAAMERTAPLGFEAHMPIVFGVDPAYEGTDRSSIVMRQGLFAKRLFVGRGLTTDKLAERANTLYHEHKPQTIFVDKTGVGAGVLDQLRNMGAPVIGVAFSESPEDTERFANKRAEVWWKVKEWLELGAVLERDQDLRTDLIGPEYFSNDKGKIQLESKDSMRKRGLASPDLGDALALTFARPVAAGGMSRLSNPIHGTGRDREYSPYNFLNG